MSGAVTTEKKVSEFRKARLLLVLVTVAGTILLSRTVIYDMFLDFVLPDKEVYVVLEGKKVSVKEAYRLIPKREFRIRKLWGRGKIKTAELTERISRLENIRTLIKKRYPLPTLQNLLSKRNYPGAKGKAVIGYFGFLALSIMPIVAIYVYDKKRLKDFFFQVGRKEDPIEKGQPVEFINWQLLGVSKEFVLNRLFKSEEAYKEAMAVFDHQIIADKRIYDENEEVPQDSNLVVISFPELSKDIKNLTEKLYSYGKRIGLIKDEDKEEFVSVIALILFHFVSSYFGNVPTGFLVPRLNSYAARRMMGMYFYGKTVNVVFKDVVKVKERKPSDWLRVFHGYRKEKGDFLAKLRDKYSRIPEIFPLRDIC